MKFKFLPIYLFGDTNYGVVTTHLDKNRQTISTRKASNTGNHMVYIWWKAELENI